MGGEQMKKFYVFSSDSALSAENKQQIKDVFKERFSGLPLLILDRGMSLSLVDEESGTISSTDPTGVKGKIGSDCNSKFNKIIQLK